MKLLILCLFFGIICAKNKETPIVSNDELVQMVKELKSQVDDLKTTQNSKRRIRIDNLKIELDYLKADVSDQESRIQANEEGLEVNICYLLTKTIEMNIFFFLILGFGNYCHIKCHYPCDIFGGAEGRIL